ncbi:baseplate wedge protein 53 [Clostridium botulinum]|uniref:baseplate wedge protein 53 n=1 Tax=Clostridium botulinum TaxID=1491 RepID=UPI0013F02AB2|nr:baseplate wedge protein 53 [Clostridium botulinum]EGT5649348.1 hypothetical protein [Clostridium botulinum]MBY6755550.1 baseplate wedge protein 53 [Clostridium botulinum]MBY6766477.1 baseplate wedge protein 53 [Clostridium botulinum]MBY6900452.1 baseplate wedge protein 53 [Clostridium botulinum]MBY6914759.1 baseplate wedge protein 53 [Clostridium botulinum]
MDIVEYMTKDRKLKLEEYDENGNLIDIREFQGEDLFNFIHYQTNFHKALSVARKKDVECFSKDEIKIINDIINLSKLRCAYGESDREFYWFTDEESKIFKEIFETVPKQDLKFALELTNKGHGAFNTSLKSEYSHKKFSLIEALKFIKNRDGIYYTVNNNGKRIYDFVDKPTKKQVKYQRVKNGNRTVFLSFRDWSEYIVDEDELV